LVLPPDGKTVQDINNQKNQFLYLITKGFQDGICRGTTGNVGKKTEGLSGNKGKRITDQTSAEGLNAE
jgi:hypothetical protein